MAEQLVTVKPFAYYVREEAIAPAPAGPLTGAYNVTLQMWEYPDEEGPGPRAGGCGKTNTNSKLTSTRMTGNPPDFEQVWEHGDKD